jgi:hypothetical protein
MGLKQAQSAWVQFLTLKSVSGDEIAECLHDIYNVGACSCSAMFRCVKTIPTGDQTLLDANGPVYRLRIDLTMQFEQPWMISCFCSVARLLTP